MMKHCAVIEEDQVSHTIQVMDSLSHISR